MGNQKEDFQSACIRSSEELRCRYPEGMFIYYQPDAVQAARVKDILTVTFPRHLVFVSNFHFLAWPADSGMQIENTLYSKYNAVQYIQEGLKQAAHFPQASVDQLIPKTKGPHLVGGLLVPVPRTRVIACSSDHFFSSHEPKSTFKKERIHAIYLDDITAGLNQLKARAISNDWIYRGKHSDLVVTGVDRISGDEDSIRWYVDDALYAYIRQENKVHNDFIKSAQLFPHDLAMRGGLNITYVRNGREWVALVPSRSAIDPLAEELTGAGYRIVEVGEDEVSAEYCGGVKCRSLTISWRR